MDACTDGDIRMMGVSSTSTIAGRVDLCYQSQWRAVCQSMWDRDDSMVVCRQFGFPAEGNSILNSYKPRWLMLLVPLGAQFCTNSCLGRNNTMNGIHDFRCSGIEDRLIGCPSALKDNGCGETIGVICCKKVKLFGK